MCLQLAAFFTLASTGLWIDKVSTGPIRHVAEHLTMYEIAFVVVAIVSLFWCTVKSIDSRCFQFELPWLILVSPPNLAFVV